MPESWGVEVDPLEIGIAGLILNNLSPVSGAPSTCSVEQDRTKVALIAPYSPLRPIAALAHSPDPEPNPLAKGHNASIGVLDPIGKTWTVVSEVRAVVGSGPIAADRPEVPPAVASGGYFSSNKPNAKAGGYQAIASVGLPRSWRANPCVVLESIDPVILGWVTDMI